LFFAFCFLEKEKEEEEEKEKGKRSKHKQNRETNRESKKLSQIIFSCERAKKEVASKKMGI